MKLGVWLVAGTPVDQPYPCRCHERKGRQCSAAWCPCAGRTDRPPNRDCCSYRFDAGDHVKAMREWRIWKLSQGS